MWTLHLRCFGGKVIVKFIIFIACVIAYTRFFRTSLTRSKKPGLTNKDIYDQNELEENKTLMNFFQTEKSLISSSPNASGAPNMHLAVVACGDRLEETLVMIKSALILSRNAIKVHIFAEYDLHLGFKQQLDKWTAALQDTFTYQLYPITYPEENSFEEWKNLKANKPCVTQRLFLPTLLEDVDSVLYVDTDILFLRPFVDLWNFFKYFNSSHIAALAPERMHRLDGYDHFVLLPHYGLKGLNSGVILMNLTRMREFPWKELITKFYLMYKFSTTLDDQDLINIVFHFHPEKVFELTCDWNYRSDCCMYASVCKDAEKEGISVLHGNRRMYHNDKQPPFNAVYEAFRKYTMGQDLRTGLLEQMKINLDKGPKSNCGYVKHIFIKQIEKQITLLEGRS